MERDDGGDYFVGLPALILEKDGVLQWVQDDRCFDVLDFFYPDEE